MARKERTPWATRLRDLLRGFVAANNRTRLRFVLVQTIGANIKGLQPSVDQNCWRTITPVTLGDGTPAVRWVYRFGRDDDPAISLIERGNDILKRHGDEILKLFGLKFVDSGESNWPWLLARLREVEHPFRGDIKSDRTLAGVASPNEMAEAVAFTLGQGPKPSWWDKRNKSFRVDIPHVAVASIAAIRAILDRVELAKLATIDSPKDVTDERVEGELLPALTVKKQREAEQVATAIPPKPATEAAGDGSGKVKRNGQSDTAKKSTRKTKRRELDSHGWACIDEFKGARKRRDPQKMSEIVREYVAEHHDESESSLLKALYDNSDQWKPMPRKAE